MENPENDKYYEESVRLTEMVKRVLSKYLPSDMDPENTLARTGLLMASLPVTRTNAIALAAASAYFAVRAGLEKEQIVGLISELIDEYMRSEPVQELRSKYANENAMAKEAAKLAKDKNVIMSPLSGGDKPH